MCSIKTSPLSEYIGFVLEQTSEMTPNHVMNNYNDKSLRKKVAVPN